MCTNVDTGWPRCIKFLKLQVSFRITATLYRALLLKTTYEDTASCVSLTPCTQEPLTERDGLSTREREVSSNRERPIQIEKEKRKTSTFPSL